MAKIALVTASRNASHERQVSELGRRLRKISEKIALSGEKPLTRSEVQRETSMRRGGLR